MFILFVLTPLKYYIYLCKFKKAKPNFDAFKLCMKTQKYTEYHLAKKREKLLTHFKKWKYNLFTFTCSKSRNMYCIYLSISTYTINQHITLIIVLYFI